MDMTRIFLKQKTQALSGIDLSRKGSIDEPIVDLISDINSQKNYFTLSSCSGRVCVVEDSQEIANGDSDVTIHKKGCRWLYTTHSACDDDAVMQSFDKSVMNASFKYEAFVMHVQCCHLVNAQDMHAVAMASGFRNSGISLSKKGKIVLAVRSTHSLEAPCTDHGRLLVTPQYVKHLCNLANTKMEENLRRIQRFHQGVLDLFTKATAAGESGDAIPAPGGVNRRQRRMVKKQTMRHKPPPPPVQIPPQPAGDPPVQIPPQPAGDPPVQIPPQPAGDPPVQIPPQPAGDPPVQIPPQPAGDSPVQIPPQPAEDPPDNDDLYEACVEACADLFADVT